MVTSTVLVIAAGVAIAVVVVQSRKFPVISTSAPRPLSRFCLRSRLPVALRGRHVDGLRRRLIVEESLAEVSGRFIFGTTKSHARRQVPIPTSLVARLPIRGPEELLFLGPKGGALRYRYFYMKHWRPALTRLELPAVGVTRLATQRRGPNHRGWRSPKTLQTVLGHRSASFSLTVYGHLFDADLDDLADRLDNPAPKVEGTR